MIEVREFQRILIRLPSRERIAPSSFDTGPRFADKSETSNSLVTKDPTDSSNANQIDYDVGSFVRRVIEETERWLAISKSIIMYISTNFSRTGDKVVDSVRFRQLLGRGWTAQQLGIPKKRFFLVLLFLNCMADLC